FSLDEQRASKCDLASAGVWLAVAMQLGGVVA
ncbi:unnamed protein product, partial [marine sediment metagenome]